MTHQERPVSPYHKPGFYDEALAKDRHRDIVGGRWDETGRAEMQILLAAGLAPHHHLLDIGAGSLRLGCKVVPYLEPHHYWATDKSGALMRRGYDCELADKTRLPPGHLVEDEDFAFPSVPPAITHALAFAVFTHLPLTYLGRALPSIHAAFPNLQALLFTVFLAPTGTSGSHRQADGVVTHTARAPYHFDAHAVLGLCQSAGFIAAPEPGRLPRGQVLFIARRA